MFLTRKQNRRRQNNTEDNAKAHAACNAKAHVAYNANESAACNPNENVACNVKESAAYTQDCMCEVCGKKGVLLGVLHNLSFALEIFLLGAVPCVLGACAYFQIEQAALLCAVAALCAIGIVCLDFEMSHPKLQQIMPTVVLGSLAAAGRILCAPFPGFKPVLAICIIGGVVFGRRSGFLIGSLAAVVSNFFFGQGPWTLWQMYTWGLAGYGAAFLFRHDFLNKTPLLCIYGFVSALLCGVLLNGWYLVGFIRPITLLSVLATLGSGLVFDVVHGIATVIFLLMLYKPWRRKLERICSKYALKESML